MLHLLALLPLSLVDGKFPSENRRNLSRPNLLFHFGGLGQTDTKISRKSSEKGLKNGSDSAKLSHEKNV